LTLTHIYLVDEEDKLIEFVNNETLSDMRLIVNNTPIHLHKVILYSRSEMLRKLIESNPNEKMYHVNDLEVNVNLFIQLVSECECVYFVLFCFVLF
jgi:hypothetical protein